MGDFWLGYGITADSLTRAQRGNTLAANIAAAKLLCAPNILCGAVRQFGPQNFSLVLTSYGGHVTPSHDANDAGAARSPTPLPS
jgi:hypothetical protein